MFTPFQQDKISVCHAYAWLCPGHFCLLKFAFLFISQAYYRALPRVGRHLHKDDSDRLHVFLRRLQ